MGEMADWTIENGILEEVEEPRDDVCKKHPRYSGQRRPRSRCAACWAIYREIHGEEPTDA